MRWPTAEDAAGRATAPDDRMNFNPLQHSAHLLRDLARFIHTTRDSNEPEATFTSVIRVMEWREATAGRKHVKRRAVSRGARAPDIQIETETETETEGRPARNGRRQRVQSAGFTASVYLSRPSRWF